MIQMNNIKYLKHVNMLIYILPFIVTKDFCSTLNRINEEWKMQKGSYLKGEDMALFPLYTFCYVHKSGKGLWELQRASQLLHIHSVLPTLP